MAFRKSIPMSELREKVQEKPDSDRHGTTYQASRGGWYPDNKPHQQPKGGTK